MREWMEMDLDLPERPEFLRIMLLTGDSRDVVLGRLFRLWRWVARHAEDGCLPGMTIEALNDLLDGGTDFWRALADEHVGWLEIQEDALVIPGWSKRFGRKAKLRRADQCRQSVDKLSTTSADMVWPIPKSRRTSATPEIGGADREDD